MVQKVVEFFRHKDKNTRDNRWIFGSMLVGSVLSLIAAFALSVDAVQLAKDPNATLSCSVNVLINCATVAKHPSAMMFGFPNSFLGLISEPVVITVAIAGLSGIRFPKKFMFVAQVFYTLGFLFALYLLSISYFVIGALCPWCLLVTLTTTLVFFAMTRYNVREENLYLPKKAAKRLKYWFEEKDYDKLVMWALIAFLTAMILIKYSKGLFG